MPPSRRGSWPSAPLLLLSSQSLQQSSALVFWDWHRGARNCGRLPAPWNEEYPLLRDFDQLIQRINFASIPITITRWTCPRALSGQAPAPGNSYGGQSRDVSCVLSLPTALSLRPNASVAARGYILSSDVKVWHRSLPPQRPISVVSLERTTPQRSPMAHIGCEWVEH
jgi:hypothetical protein